MIDQETRRIIAEEASRHGIDANALLAVTEVESGGKVFAVIGSRHEPLIRFEAHYFDRRLSNGKKRAAREAGLASPVAGRIANPPSHTARWRMLDQAIQIDRAAALESVSWGIGQVMGAHWAWLGYGSVEDLVAEARSGAGGQARLMLRYIAKSGLSEALNRRDWEAFARGYNGPDFSRYAYQTKLALAFRKYCRLGEHGKGRAASGAAQTGAVLCFGMRGKAVEDLQQMLCALGFPVLSDGIYGRQTQKAVRRFQARYGLAIDGVAGPQTARRLQEQLAPGFSLAVLFKMIAKWFLSLWRQPHAGE